MRRWRRALSDTICSLEEEVYFMLEIHTVLISLNVYWGTFGSVPHTCAGQHPQPVARPFQQLVNDKLSRIGILYLNDRGFAVRSGFWHVENLVVGNHAVLLIFWRGLPNNP